VLLVRIRGKGLLEPPRHQSRLRAAPGFSQATHYPTRRSGSTHQDTHSDSLPVGTGGGILAKVTLPPDAAKTC